MDQAKLKQILDYSPQTGVFTWRVNRPPRGKAGFPAGFDNGAGYVKISINNVRYYGHRLAFLWMLGEYPDVVDHINGIPSDNRWENLRSVTQAKNCSNKTNGTGVRFLYGRWYARYSDTHLGVFDSKAEADASYRAAKIARAGIDPFQARDGVKKPKKTIRQPKEKKLFDGKCLNIWAKELGIPQQTLHYRIYVRGLSFADAIKPKGTTTGPGARGCPDG